MNWYYVDQGKQAGPVDDAQFEELRRTGRIQADTLVWHEGMPNWLPLSQAKPSAPAPAAGEPPPASAAALPTGETTEAVCTECGRIFPRSNMIRHGNAHVCAGCKPVFMQKIAEGARINTGELRYAGFWIRFAAKFLDGLIIGLVVALPLIAVAMFIPVFGITAASAANAGFAPNAHVLGAAGGEEVMANLIGILFQFVGMAAGILFTTFFHGKFGATPGKMICKIHVVDSTGAKIGYGRAFGRACAEILSGIVCYIGYLIAGFDSQKRSLHDHICNTRVVFK